MITENELKALLLEVRESEEFSLYYTGEKDKRIDAFYTYDKKEININEKNFEVESELIYTALHEYAHHLQSTESFVKDTPHDNEFWKIFHSLLYTAEEKGLYINCCYVEHKESFKRILHANEQFNKATIEFFEALGEFCNVLSKENRNQFIDCCERYLKIPKSEAKKIVKASQVFGKGYQYNTMIRLASKKNMDQGLLNELAYMTSADEKRKSITFDIFKYYNSDHFESETVYLENKKEKIETTIENGKEKIESIEHRLSQLFSDKE